MGDAPADARIKWIEERVLPLLKTKSELFTKLLSTEEGELVRRFCDGEGCSCMFFYGGAKELAVTDKLPSTHKKKVVFCQKTKDAKLDEKNIESMFERVIVGDLNGPILENLHGVLRNVYLPVVTQQSSEWPEVAMKAFADKYHDTLSAVVTAIGQTRGKTLLALPPAEDPATAVKPGNDKDRVHILESAVVRWSARINHALSRNPESVFDGGVHPGPIACLEFWNMKMVDLGEIIDQLRGPQISKVAGSLQPPYHAAALVCFLCKRCRRFDCSSVSRTSCLGTESVGTHPLALLCGLQCTEVQVAG